MGSPSLPPAPDYKAAAQATASGNQNASLAAQIGNMTNQSGPVQYRLNERGEMLDAAGNVTNDASKAQQLGSTGVNYVNPAKPDQFGRMPFDQANLTPAQQATYASTGVLPKGFNVTYLPQQWTQNQVLGGNDQALYNQSLAAQLGLSEMALTGLDKVRGAIGESVTPSIQIQGGPNSTTGGMTTSIGTGGGLDAGRATGFADQDQVQRFVANAGDINSNVANAGQINTSVADAGKINGNIANAGVINGRIANAGNILTATGANGLAQTSLNNNGNLIQLNSNANQQAGALGEGLNNAANIKTNLGIDPNLLNEQAVDALYKANTQYLDPQFGQSQSKLENQLANQGITRGSEAYNNAMLNFNNQKQQAYESARNQAIGQGTAAAQGLFGMGLQSAQFGNTSLGQQFGQNLTAQQLANAASGQNNANAQTNMRLANDAIGQQFGQGLQSAQFGNQAIAQNNANAMANSQFTNAAQAQQYGQNANDTNVANAAQNQQFNQNARVTDTSLAAQAQQYGQNLNNANFGNAAQAQQYGQNLSDTNVANAAQNQQYNQNLNNAQFTNAAGQQYFNNNLSAAQLQNAATAQNFGMDLTNQQQRLATNQANAALNNQALESQYNQALQSAQLSNQASNQQLAQNQAIQQNPLNILQALRTGAQLNTANLPAVGVSQPGQLANWSGPDMLGAATAQGQYDQSIYNAKSAANSALTSSLIGAGGALGSAGIKVASDRRLKKNIIKLGTHKTLGIGLYTWDYLWGEKGAGVMAQELEKVMPKAVITHESGFKMVDYSMLGA